MAIDELRKQKRRPKKQQSDDVIAFMATLRDDRPDMDTQAILSERGTKVRQALEELPSPQQEVLELAYFRGLTQREISELLGVPLGTIKTRMRLGLRKLQDSIDLQHLDTQ